QQGSSFHNRAPNRRTCGYPRRSKFLLKHLVHDFRISLPTRRFHYLSDKKSEEFFVTAPICFDVCSICRDHFVDDLFDRNTVRYLLKTLFLDDLIRGPAASEHFHQDLFSLIVVDLPRFEGDQKLGKVLSSYKTFGNALSGVVELTRQLAKYPICSQLGICSDSRDGFV